MASKTKTKNKSVKSKKRPKVRPKVERFTLNQDFEFFSELRSLVLKSSAGEKERMIQKVSNLGRIRLAVISGIFLRRNSKPKWAIFSLVFLSLMGLVAVLLRMQKFPCYLHLLSLQIVFLAFALILGSHQSCLLSHKMSHHNILFLASNHPPFHILCHRNDLQHTLIL